MKTTNHVHRHMVEARLNHHGLRYVVACRGCGDVREIVRRRGIQPEDFERRELYVFHGFMGRPTHVEHGPSGDRWPIEPRGALRWPWRLWTAAACAFLHWRFRRQMRRRS